MKELSSHVRLLQDALVNTTQKVEGCATVDSVSSVSDELANFRNLMNTGFDTLTAKIEQFEPRVKSLEQVVLAPGTGLQDRVTVLANDIANASNGLRPRLDQLEVSVQQLHTQQSAPSSGVNAGVNAGQISAVDFQALQKRVSELETIAATQKQDVILLSNWADVMHKDHFSLQRQVQFNTAKHHANDVLVGGIAEAKDQDCHTAAMDFFKNKLDLDVVSTDVWHAKCIGTQRMLRFDAMGKVVPSGGCEVLCPRHMVVHCSFFFKRKLMDVWQRITGKKSAQGNKYFVAHYQPEAFKASKEKNKDAVDNIYAKNAGKTSDQHTYAHVVGTELVINNKVKVPHI